MRILSFRPNSSDGWGGPLYMTEFERTVAKSVEYIRAGIRYPFYKPDESVADAVKRICGNEPPDWVFHSPLHAEAPRRRNYRLAFYSSDLHGYGTLKIGRTVGFLKLMNSKGFDAIFMKYQLIRGTNKPVDFLLKNLKARLFFLPYSVDPDKYYLSEDRVHDISMIGSVGGPYPLRVHLWKELPDFCEERGLSLLLNKPEFPKCTWDGASKYASDPRYYLHRSYEEALSQTKFFIFDSSRYGYPLQKFFEGMASGCVVFSDKPEHTEELGFINNENYVEITRRNWKKRLDYFFDHPDKAQEISENARKLILERHTHEIRAKEFLKMLEDF